MGFRPRQRAVSQVPRTYWPSHSNKRVLGFAGYKAGMTHVSYTDPTESPTKGQVVMAAATVIEVPPLVVYGVRCYDKEKSTGDILVQDVNILKKLGIKKSAVQDAKPKTQNPLPPTPNPLPQTLRDIRLLTFAQPAETSIGKKHIERMEIGIGGKDGNEKLEYAKSLLGKELRAGDVFKPGEFVDVITITKGKGWQGAVKRFGVAKQRRKATGKVRHVGTLGQWHPAYVLYTVPQAGQMGYHKRTELNKRILKIGNDVETVNPHGGFPHYGFVRNDYILVKGSVPGPYRRLLKLRLGIRSPAQTPESKLAYVARP